MDALVSLPLVSYLLVPGTTSWSTSLNLLFFTMTWTLSHPPLQIELVAVLAVRIIFWLLPSLLSLIMDLLVPSLARQSKHQGASALPPRDAAMLGRASRLAALNVFLLVLAEGGISYGLLTLLGHPAFSTAATPPLPWTMAKHLVLLLFADHPVASLLLRFVPPYVPALALRPHMLTYLAFVSLATVEETASHSGYAVVPGILLGGVARRTAVHYCRGKGNFGAWGLPDWAHGTSAGGQDVVDDIKDEAEKHYLPERSEEAAGKMPKEGVDNWSGRLGVRKRRG